MSRTMPGDNTCHTPAAGTLCRTFEDKKGARKRTCRCMHVHKYTIHLSEFYARQIYPPTQKLLNADLVNVYYDWNLF